MKDNIENKTQNQDVIDLGVASVETKGSLLFKEDQGGTITPGISEE